MSYITESTEKAAKELKLDYGAYNELLKAVEQDIKHNMTEVNKETKQDSEKQETKQDQQQSIMKMARSARVIK
ncbi:capsid morphogenesis B protein [Staphylococcus succinus]|uniref:capsid morphogenesis B protein n=1 Tax=Staphylococcus succinus TaxID=61015 RepID=UPI001C04802C|nr:capsid morphogenesis B protein [Staphylococcus succinus]MBU0439056.1 capsid morphogenesis B protein [Staphylococcus succinus]